MSRELTPDQIEAFVVAAQSGDEECFASIFDHFYDKITRYVSFRVDEEDTEDIVSDVFLKVVEKLHSYQRNETIKGSSFSSWLFRIAHNTVIDFYRSRRPLISLYNEDTGEIRFDIPDEALTPEKSLNKKYEAEKIRGILRDLTPIHAEILELKFLEQFNTAEIAHITGKSEGNIRVIQLRALREMRKVFEKSEGK